MNRWPIVSLGDVVSQTWRGESPLPGRAYRLMGVRLWGQGAYARETIDGSGTQYSQLFRVEEGDIVVNKIWARNGSVSVVNADLAGAYGSPEFPTYAPKQDRLLPRWAYWFTRSPLLWKQCDELSRGTSGQNRLRPERFLDVQIPLPPIAEQQRIVAQLDAADEGRENHRISTEGVRREVDATLLAAFRDVIKDAPLARMDDIAPLVRRVTEIDPDWAYPELGIRSFGKGTFHKPAIKGMDLGSKRLFKIAAGDLLFNIVFAWEGAIAVASEDDHGRFGSHRFLTCVPDANRTTSTFLRFYFLTDEGMRKIGEASPGGAGRNRTLGLKSLEAIQVPVPSRDAQLWFDELLAKATSIRTEQAKSLEEMGRLIPSLLDRLLKGKASDEMELLEKVRAKA
jgi:type I restriction enzyme, S subunit